MVGSTTTTSKKRRAEKTSLGNTTHLSTLHRRLQAALNLGTRYYNRDKKRGKWECKDIEIQKHVLRSISAFLECASQETTPHNPTVKDSVADLAEVLVGILEEKSGATIITATNLVLKLVSCLNSFIPQTSVIDLILPLTSLAAAHQSQVAISSARPLDLLLSNVSRKKEKEVWHIIRESEIVAHLIANMLGFSCNVSSTEYFEEMASLLGTILWRWPQCRYQVWKNDEFLKLLDVTSMRPDLSMKVSMLKLYSAIALCGHGATKIIEKGGSFLEMMVYCMGSSQPLSLQMEGFKLAQCLMMNEKGGLMLLSLCGESIVKSIISAMKEWRPSSERVSNDQILLLIEACRLALITRWQGEHHKHFWRMRIDKVLFDLLMPEFREKTSLHRQFSLDNLIAIASESLKTSSLLVLRPYIWDILGWLATNCPEEFEPNMDGNGLHIDMIIACACLAFEDIMSRGQQLCQDDIGGMLAVRSVLMMIYSPSEYVSSKAKFILLKILKPSGDRYLNNLMYSLNSTLRGNHIEILGIYQVAILLIGFTCYLALPQYRELVVKEARAILMAFVSRRLSKSFCLTRSSFSLHLNIMFLERTCCCNVPEDWEGRDMLLFYSLWGLTESIRHYEMGKICLDISTFEMEHKEANLVNKLLDVCNDTSTGSARWFASYVLSYFGFFGFPSKFGEAMGKALVDDNHVDTELLLADGKLLCVHGVILAVRCPSLLPPAESSSHDEASADLSGKSSLVSSLGKTWIRIRLSSHVDRTELIKLLDYIYSGYLKEKGDTLKKLRILTKHCGLQSLYNLLSRRIPRWGTPTPTFDLSPALDTSGQKFSDIVLEAKAAEAMSWACKLCSSSVPHIHAHKIVLWASCDHMRAMLRSGMQECQSPVLKVPVRWQALVKLVHWFYSYKLPKLPSGCLWDNLDLEKKLQQLEPYAELCWLGEFWLLEGVQDECLSILTCGLKNSSGLLSVKILQTAANFSQWKLAEVAANHVASSYRQLCESGDLEELDEPLVEIVRAASVKLSQVGTENAHDNDSGFW